MAKGRQLTSKSNARGDSLGLNLHDCVSLGEVEKGLDNIPTTTSSKARVIDPVQNGQDGIMYSSTDEEIHRLPFLLRLLHASRPLSAIPTFLEHEDNLQLIGQQQQQQHDDMSVENAMDVEDDAIICDVVNRLEDRAAAYSAAEGVQIVACYLAPAVAKHVRRVPLLPVRKNQLRNRKHTSYLDMLYDTTLLEEGLKKIGTTSIYGRSTGRSKKRPRSSDIENDIDEEDDVKGGTSDGSENEMETLTNDTKKDAKMKTSRDEEIIEKVIKVSEDSQEYAVSKTMQELIRVTLKSLKQSPSSTMSAIGSTMEDEEGEVGGDSANSVNRALSITMHDTILSETVPTSQHQSGISDLPSTVACLMHHTPCLRHRHVAVSTQ
jgi:hypothetical protein